MSEFSMPWADTTDPGPQVGDGQPYTAAQWDQAWEIWFQQMAAASYFVLKGVWNALAVTSPGANQISVNTGAAMGKGHIYWNDAALALAPASAAAGQTRQDSVILETDWGGTGATEQYTTRIVIKQGTAGAPPAMTQTDNTLWQNRLYDFTIDDAGVVSGITDQRAYCRFSTEVSTAMCAAGLLSADAAGRALIAAGFFTNAVLISAIGAGAFQADAATRTLFADGIWTAAKLAAGVGPVVGDLKENATASLGGSDGRRMVVGGVAHESWVHCDGGAAVNGVTIPDYRGKVIAGASASHAAGTTGGADTADLSHTHPAGTLAGPSHVHWANLTSGAPLQAAIMNEKAASNPQGGPTPSHTHTSSGNVGAGGTGAVTGSTDDGGGVAQDIRQATAYVYRFIYVG